MVQAFRSSSPRWPIAVMACVLLVVACRTESDDAKEGSQTNDKKQGTTKTESVPLPTSKHASEEEPVQVDDRAAVHDVILATEDEDSAAADAGTIKGVAEWNDAPFKQRPVPGVEGADPHCTRVHQKTPILRESLIVNPNSTVKDVLVYVKRGLPADKTWPVPCEHVLLDQNGCRYVPHVFGIMAGQGLVIRNSDATLHNIHCTPKNNPGFNTGQPKRGMEFNWKFGNAEIMIHLKCNSHAWMSAYAAVMDHPFFAVTDNNGEFEISGLPDGEYVIAAWHERFKKGREQNVAIRDGETKEIEFVFKRPKKNGN